MNGPINLGSFSVSWASVRFVSQPRSVPECSCVPQMIFEGKYELKAPREKVWEFIIDPARIGKCLPELKSMEVESEDRFAAVIRLGVGPLRTDFKFSFEITGKEPISNVRLRAVGAGSGSNVTIDTTIELKEIAAGSELIYSANANVAGIMASLGQRVIRDTAEKTVTAIFECVKTQVE
jgi:carbon monoxide dehydrogenase subunit G